MVKGLTKQGVKGIDWCDYTWPIVTGCDNRFECYDYCYARTIHKRFLMGHPHYNDDFSYRFNADILAAPTHLKKPSVIFIGSMAEWWHPDVPTKHQVDILSVVNACPQHTFICLTKQISVLDMVVGFWQADRLPGDEPMWRSDPGDVLPRNLWTGVTVSTTEDLQRLYHLKNLEHSKKFISFEPLLGDVAGRPYFSLEGIGWVIIGGLSNGPHKVNPDNGHFMRLYGAARRAGIPVMVKHNCTILSNPPKEYPEDFP